MQITVKKKPDRQVPADWRTLPSGIVIEGFNGYKALVYQEANESHVGPALLLLESSITDFTQARGILGYFVSFKVLGQITEIIVEEK